MRGVSGSSFPTTSWSLVLAAAANPTADSRTSLATLCKVYWQPISVFIRGKVYDRNEAEDLTQAFFAVMLEKNYIRDADRERGPFRTFILAAVKHFLANEWDKAAEYFDKLLFLLNGESPASGYEALAGELGASLSALRVAVHRMRRRYREMRRTEIAETVSKPTEIDEEIRFLLSALRE